MTDETYPVLSRGWRCVFKISLNVKSQTISNSTQGWGNTAGSFDRRGGLSKGMDFFFGRSDVAQGYFDKGDAAQIIVGGGGAPRGLQLVGVGGQHLGNVTLGCGGANINAPTLHIQTKCE